MIPLHEALKLIQRLETEVKPRGEHRPRVRLSHVGGHLAVEVTWMGGAYAVHRLSGTQILVDQTTVHQQLVDHFNGLEP